MHEPLLEKFEDEGGERIQRSGGHNTEDSWGSVFPGIDEAVRAIASVSLWVGGQKSVLEERRGCRPLRNCRDHQELRDMEMHLEHRISIQSFGLSWIVS